jgi:hypothetical protein
MFMFNRSSVTRIFAPLITAIGTSVLLAIPAGAATWSRAETTFSLNNFSELPLGIDTFRDAKAQVIAPDGGVKSNADADALFRVDLINPANSLANGFVDSVVNGSGQNYFGRAEGVAQIIGYTFQIDRGETFSFDFSSSLNLNTSVDQPGIETAMAIGTIGLELYDATDPANLTLLDFLTIDGNLGTPGQDQTLTVDQSAGITFNTKQTVLTGSPGSNQVAAASVQGRFSRSFTNATALTLVEFSVNQATVAVPEPANGLALLVVVGGLAIRVKKGKVVGKT